MAAVMHPAVVETHLSTLFFYGDRVVKVRRPVVHGLADFRSLERRRASCEREVALNRRLAPDVYLGTATIAANGDPVEHAVVMRRLEKSRSLAAMARRNCGLDGAMEQLAAVLVTFHAGADRSARIDAAATGAALWHRWQAVEEAMGRFVGPVVDAASYRELTALARKYVEGREALFRRRIAEGAVCDGHGNLENTDVFFLDDGPRILDRLALDEEGRYGDVIADVACLVQDLELAGAYGAANTLLAAYHRCSGRELPASLLHFYVAQRAHIRAFTQCLRTEDRLRTVVPPALLVDQAVAHLRAALPRLLLVGGLPRSGKSTLAAWVGSQLGAEVLSAPHGGCPTPGPVATMGLAGEEVRSQDEPLCKTAAARLATGHSVVLDAPWSTVADRRMAEDVARRSSAQLVALRCWCPGDERRARIDDSRPEALRDPLEDPWPEALVVDTSSVAEASPEPGPAQPGTIVVPTRPSRRSCARSSGPMAARPPVAAT